MCDELCSVHYTCILFQKSKVEVILVVYYSVYFSYIGLLDVLVSILLASTTLFIYYA
jgi:hypothetical protein